VASRYRPVLLRLAFVCLAFAVMTAIMTAPFSWQFTDHLIPHNDNYMHVWVLAWTARQLVLDPAHLFSANIFFPAPNALAFSDAFPLLGLIGSPLIWAGMHPVAVLNLLILTSFVASGLGMFVLAFELTGAMVPAMLAGTIFTFASQRFAHLAHIELLWQCWMPLAMWALYRLMKNGKLLDGALLGVFIALQGLSSLYYFVLLGTYLGITGIALIDRPPVHLWKRRAAGIALAAMTAAVLVGPYLATYSEMRSGHRTRQYQEVLRYSASPQTYLRVVPENRLYWFLRRERDAQERSLFPGALALALAAIGIWKGSRRIVVVCVAGMMFAFLMSLGMNGWLFPLFRQLATPLEDIRAPARYGILVLMSLAALAALGASHILANRPHRRWLVSAAFFAMLFLEYASMPVETFKPILQPPQLARWLSNQPPNSVTVTLPIGYWDHDPLYEFLSIYHWQPMINGYTGFVPEGFEATIAALMTFPDAASIQLLRDRHVSYVVLSAKDYGEPRYSELTQALRGHPDFDEPVSFDDPDFPCTVFRLRR
jgi:hypothetical protein